MDADRQALQEIQRHFHALIQEIAGALVEKRKLSLPELTPLLNLDKPEGWFPIPGMAGGFLYHLEGQGKNLRLIVDSWSRFVMGSEQQHEITSSGYRPVPSNDPFAGIRITSPGDTDP